MLLYNSGWINLLGIKELVAMVTSCEYHENFQYTLLMDHSALAIASVEDGLYFMFVPTVYHGYRGSWFNQILRSESEAHEDFM